jgi:hypothetical protein
VLPQFVHLGVLGGVPVAIIVIAITLVGLPVSLMLLALYLAAIYLAKIWVGPFLGRMVLKSAVTTKREWLLGLLGIELLRCARLHRVDAEHGVAPGYDIELRERHIVRHREVLAATRGDLAVRLQDWASLPGGDFGELHRA